MPPEAPSLSETLLQQLLETTNEINAKVAVLTASMDALGKRLDKVENQLSKACHEPPCRSLSALVSRVESIERWRQREEDGKKALHGRFSNLFWQLVAYALTAGLGVLGTLLVLGGKSYFQQ